MGDSGQGSDGKRQLSQDDVDLIRKRRQLALDRKHEIILQQTIEASMQSPEAMGVAGFPEPATSAGASSSSCITHGGARSSSGITRANPQEEAPSVVNLDDDLPSTQNNFEDEVPSVINLDDGAELVADMETATDDWSQVWRCMQVCGGVCKCMEVCASV